MRKERHRLDTPRSDNGPSSVKGGVDYELVIVSRQMARLGSTAQGHQKQELMRTDQWDAAILCKSWLGAVNCTPTPSGPFHMILPEVFTDSPW